MYINMEYYATVKEIAQSLHNKKKIFCNIVFHRKKLQNIICSVVPFL